MVTEATVLIPAGLSARLASRMRANTPFRPRLASCRAASGESMEMNRVCRPLFFSFSRLRGVSGEPLVTTEGRIPLARA